MEMFNSPEATNTAGTELLARFRHGDFDLVATHTVIHSTIFYTDRHRLENPYRSNSVPNWVLLIERRCGPARLFINAENLSNIKQTRYDWLVRPSQHFDGRWTVDAWAPLEGRVINGGLRWSF